MRTIPAAENRGVVDCSLLSARVWNQARQCLHDKSTELSTIQSFIQLYGYTVW